MGSLLSWNKWLSLKESNARKRLVTSSTKGLAPNLPGSTAACPSTNPMAMKQAKKRGEVGLQTESKKTPSYSFDVWLKKVQKLGDDVKDVVDKGKEKGESLEKNKKDAESKIKQIDKSNKTDDSKKAEKKVGLNKGNESDKIDDESESDKNKQEDQEKFSRKPYRPPKNWQERSSNH
jgi:hypothetical protein